jgi:hypothetical protein
MPVTEENQAYSSLPEFYSSATVVFYGVDAKILEVEVSKANSSVSSFV